MKIPKGWRKLHGNTVLLQGDLELNLDGLWVPVRDIGWRAGQTLAGPHIGRTNRKARK